MAGIYIHIPFCKRKCFYCDFYSVGAKNAPWREYIDTLLAELSTRAHELAGRPVTTLYIGGGTPSALPAGELSYLIDGVRDKVDMRLEECTVEVNPDDVTPALVEEYMAAGVDRVSMGVQSFSDAELTAVGRRHTAARAREAYELLRRVGNVSIDLMFGLPGQSLDSFARSVTCALELHPEHISAYSLMWEEGTALSVMRRQGRVSEAPEGLSLDMYALLCRKLADAGYVHYEVSNFALPGRESRHNSSYWSGEPYLGLGAGAHSYDGHRLRTSNPCDVKAYMASGGGGQLRESLSETELREEMIMTSLRTRRGLAPAEYGSRFGTEALARLQQKAAPCLAAGNLAERQGALVVPESRLMMLDSVIVSLF